MRKTLLLLSLFVVTNVIGQNIDLDCQRLSARDIDGTARYVGMAGAMTALGGDPSAVLDNPAGLGIYRHSEVMMTLAIRPETTMPLNTKQKWTNTGFNIKQVSAVFAMTKPYQTTGIVANNIMIGFQRMKTYDSKYQITGIDKNNSLTRVAAEKVSGRGITEQMLANEGADASILTWSENENIGWLSGMMYHTYLINPDQGSGDTYRSLLYKDESYSTDLLVEESGHSNHFSFDYSMNISNRFYWGIGLNISWMDYYKRTTYKEAFGAENFYLKSILQQKTVGVNGTIGFLYRPVQAFRIGASFQTPSIMKLQQASDGEILSNIAMVDTTGKEYIGTFSRLTPYVCRYTNNQFTTPLRFSISPAVQIGRYALIAFQYDLSHWKNTLDTYTFKVGVEGAINGHWLIEAGYAYESSFVKKDKQPIYAIPSNTVRLDTDWRNIYNSQYASFGFGFHGDWGIGHITYQCRWQQSDVYAHEIAAPAPMRTLTHNIVVTIGWHSL